MLHTVLKFLIYAVAASAIYIKYRLISAGVSPVSSPLPELPDFPKDLVVDITGKVEKLHVNDLIGPECIIPTIHKGKELLFVSLADGRIARVTQSKDGTTSVSTLTRTGSVPIEDTQICKGDPHDSFNTEQQCGRPLGMYLTRRSRVDPDFNDNEEDEDVLLVADAVEDSMKSSLTPDGDVTKMKRMKRKLAKAKVQQQNREILNEISLNRKNPISDNV